MRKDNFTKKNVFLFFDENIERNIYVYICMDNSGDKFTF